MKSLLFCLGFATYSAHTLDSMSHADWRLVLPWLPEQEGLLVYVVGHIPLVALVVWLTSHDSIRVRSLSRLVFCTFLVVHVAIHKGLESRAMYTFDTGLSLVLIYSAGLLGLLYLVAVGISRVVQAKSDGTK